jgi:hypothetical protein
MSSAIHTMGYKLSKAQKVVVAVVRPGAAMDMMLASKTKGNGRMERAPTDWRTMIHDRFASAI